MREVNVTAPRWWGKQRPEWLKILPEVKTKNEKSLGLQGRILTRQLKKKRKKLSQPVTLHSDAMKDIISRQSPTLLLATWQDRLHDRGFFTLCGNIKPISFPVGREKYEVTQVPGQVLPNL